MELRFRFTRVLRRQCHPWKHRLQFLDKCPANWIHLRKWSLLYVAWISSDIKQDWRKTSLKNVCSISLFVLEWWSRDFNYVCSFPCVWLCESYVVLGRRSLVEARVISNQTDEPNLTTMWWSQSQLSFAFTRCAITGLFLRSFAPSFINLFIIHSIS